MGQERVENISRLLQAIARGAAQSRSRMRLKHRAWFFALFQAVLVFCALVFAWCLRFDFSFPDRLLLLSAAPVLIAIRLVSLASFDLLHGWWRYAGVSDVLDIVKAVTLGSIAFFLAMYVFLGVTTFPRSIYVLEALMTTGLLAGVRLISRATAERSRDDSTRNDKRVMLIGAGFAAEMVIREIKRLGSGYHAVGCVDDDHSKVGIRLLGVPVLGTVDQLPAVLRKQDVDEVLIAVPSATGEQMQRFVMICGQAGVKFTTVPSLQDMIDGRFKINECREVRIEDLLGRDSVEIDLESVRKQINNQVVLVTGAAGSIGSELCHQIMEYGPAKLLCVDQSETGIFYLQLELSERKNKSEIICCVADIRDDERIRAIFAKHRPQIVFHAAAYKHVPVMERNVQEAVNNNIFALLGLLEIADQHGCKNFVLISSDKAVRPTNVMGVTKRVGELMIACRPANSMRCVSVRFGNVLGSNGSVVPIFQKQLRDNHWLTITHPDVKRYFMTTREAVSLVLQAFAVGNHGETLVLDMGEPVSILDLARTLIRLSGKSEDEVSIRFTGLREGEKLVEELVYSNEEIHATPSHKIKRVLGTPNRWFDLQRHLEQLRVYVSTDAPALIRAKLKEIVPEYSFRLEEQRQESTISLEKIAPAAATPAALLLKPTARPAKESLDRSQLDARKAIGGAARRASEIEAT
jgi:FlaA1/EpsC-like NDP-sugar epimerase